MTPDLKQHPGALAALLGALATLVGFAMDGYLPALKAIGDAFRATPVEVQQTLSAYLLASTVMQLFLGALADAYGRRRVILVSLAVFVLASGGCALAPNLTTLIAFRMLQGTSAGAGIVVGRAILRDLYDDAQSQRLLATITQYFSIAPIVAPVLGGWLYTWFGWRAVFWMMVVVSALLLGVSGRWLPETLPHSARVSMHPVVLLRGYRQMLLSARFVVLAHVSIFAFGGITIYLFSAPYFVIDHLGLSEREFAWLLTPMIVGTFIGATWSGRMAGRLSPARTVTLGLWVCGLAVISGLLVEFFIGPKLPWAIIPPMLNTLGTGMLFPTVMLLVLGLAPERRGMASSLHTFLTGVTMTLVAAMLTPIAARSAQAIAVIAAAMWVCAVIAWTLSTRYFKIGRTAP